MGFGSLDPAAVYGVGLAVIASVYIGFAVADGRWRVIAIEIVVAVLPVEVDPADGTVSLEGLALAVEPVSDVSLSRRYLLA